MRRPEPAAIVHPSVPWPVSRNRPSTGVAPTIGLREFEVYTRGGGGGGGGATATPTPPIPPPPPIPLLKDGMWNGGATVSRGSLPDNAFLPNQDNARQPQD